MEPAQHELYEYARDRIRQKKRLYFHFVVLILGSLFLFVANKWLGFHSDIVWWTWAVVVWVFIFALHFINVFIINSFMNKHWERTQIDKLMLQQAKKIAQLKNDIENSKPTAE